MAIYHYSAKSVSRGRGQNIIAKAAYNARAQLLDEKSGDIKDYSAHEDQVGFSGIFVPGNAPARMKKWKTWVKPEDLNASRSELWNSVQKDEVRQDAQFAREIVASLPHELTDEEQKWLIREFVRDHFMRKGMIADVNVHGPNNEGDERNKHVHILLTMREIGWKDFTIQDKEGEVYGLSRMAGLNAGVLRDFMKKGINRDALPEFDVSRGKRREPGKAANVKNQVRNFLKESNGNAAVFRKKLAENGLNLGNLGPKGFGLKVREWNSVEQLEEWRAAWATFCARQLGKASERRENLGLLDEAVQLKVAAQRFAYSHKTLKEQHKIALAHGDEDYAASLDREPERYKGPAVTALERKQKKQKPPVTLDDLFEQQKTETTVLADEGKKRRKQRIVKAEFATAAKKDVKRRRFNPYLLKDQKKDKTTVSGGPPVLKKFEKGKSEKTPRP